MRGTFRLLLIALALAFTGCATAYQGSGFSGGYSESQLAENVFQVSFRGNGYSGTERVSDFALLRSAEVASEHGFPFFVLVGAEDFAQRSSFTTQRTTTGSAQVVGNTVSGSATTSGGQTYTVVKPSARNTIVGLKAKPESGFAYEAVYVIKSLRAKYGISK